MGTEKHPLPNAHLARKDLFGQKRPGFRHPPATATGAEPSFLTREGDELLMPAVLALEPDKSLGQDPATEKGIKLLLDVEGQILALIRGACRERLPVLPDDLV